MIRKLSSGQYRLYSRKVDPKTGKRRNLGTVRHARRGGTARACGAVLQAPRRLGMDVVPRAVGNGSVFLRWE